MTRSLRPFLRRLVLGMAALVLLAAQSLSANDTILQYFEGSWQTIERRMPDIFASGYQAVWVPPPGRADSGGFSVGYDVYDRFDLGQPFARTLYGTTQGFRRMSGEMNHAGVNLYIDTILNHNGFRDASSPGFEANGGYPGFVTTLPGDVDGDFHGAFESSVLTGRLAGLIDIAQEKNHQFTRHPVPGFPNLISNETPRESNRQFYPDQSLPMDFGRHPFNIADPMAGDPIQENATGLLLRYLQWMVEVNGVRGFRLDAMKHIPTWFFNDFYDARVYNVGRTRVAGTPFTPFSFGEIYDSDFGVLSAYTRKDGFGNRDQLDFPLFFAMKSVFDAGGFGDISTLEFASFDASDGNPNDGSRGVMFVNSHDDFGGGFFNGYSTIPHAFILTRAGYPVVYYNAKEFGNGRDFPKDGRGDALGNFGSTIIPHLVRLGRQYARGPQFTRWADENVYIYERLDSLIVGLNDRGDSGYDQRTIDTGFAPGTVLVELTGNATDSFIDPSDDIFDTVTVAGNGQVTIRVPRSSSSSGFHGRGFVMYGLAPPNATMEILNDDGTIGPDPAGPPEGTRRLTPLIRVTDDFINVRVTVASGPQDDNALVRLNGGVVEIGVPGSRIMSGEFTGFCTFTSASPTYGGGSGIYEVTIDATGLDDGLHYLESIIFRQRNSGPPTFDWERLVVYLDREPPGVDLAFPPQTGTADITSRTYEAVVSSDRTVNSVHMLLDVPPAATDQDIIDSLSGATAAVWHDRLEWRKVLTGLSSGALEITVVAFEESGNYSITRFDNIDVDVAEPEVFLGLDTDPSSGAVTFVPIPGQINTARLDDEIVIRVDTQNVPGGPISFASGDFRVWIQINDDEPIEAVGYDPGLLPPVGILVQNDQNLGDDFDEFRFLWRGYSHGTHRIRAIAQLEPGPAEPSEAIVFVNVPESVSGPGLLLTRPVTTPEALVQPSTLPVEGELLDDLAEVLWIFVDGGGSSFLAATIDNPVVGDIDLDLLVASYLIQDVLPQGAVPIANGEITVRLVASTAPQGGISTEVSGVFDISGFNNHPVLGLPDILDDAQASFDALVVLETSAADGGFGSGPPADFGGDGTLTELHAGFRDNHLVVIVRGDMFGPGNDNLTNGSYLFIDVNAGSGEGMVDFDLELNDTQDGLRTDISNVSFRLSSALQTAGIGFDAVVGLRTPTIAFGYTFGTDGLPGSFTDFAYQPGIRAQYAPNVMAIPGAPGTTIDAPNAFEILIPMEALGNPHPTQIRLLAVTAAGNGFPSPNMLPENSSDAFDSIQTVEDVAAFPAIPGLLLNEVFVGEPDWIEVHNPTVDPVSLDGWSLAIRDADAVRADYVFPASTTLLADGYLVVSDLPISETLPTDWIRTAFNIPWDQSRGGQVSLVTPWGQGVDGLRWTDAGGALNSEPNDAFAPGVVFGGVATGPASTGAGHSLARDGSSTNTNDAADWDNASGADAFVPTPAAVNVSEPSSVGEDWRLF